MQTATPRRFWNLYGLAIVLLCGLTAVGCALEDVDDPVAATAAAEYAPTCGPDGASSCGGTCEDPNQVCQWIGAYAACGCASPPPPPAPPAAPPWPRRPPYIYND